MNFFTLLSFAILTSTLLSCSSLENNKSGQQHDKKYAVIKSYTEGKTKGHMLLPKGIDIITFAFLNEKHLYGFFGYPESIRVPPGENKIYIHYTRYGYNAFFCYELNVKPKEEFIAKSKTKGLKVSLWIENNVSNKPVGKPCKYDK